LPHTEYEIIEENDLQFSSYHLFVIKVKDSGIGIPGDKLDLVFEPFYEVQDAINHMTSKTEFMGGGIGLGLTLAKEIFESHRGSLLLESEEKKGSIFTVVLPYSRLVEEHIVQ